MKRVALIAALTIGLGLPANGADPSAPDRGLVARAEAEHVVVLYSAMSAEDTNTLVQRFETAYPITVQVLRVESSQLPAKLAIAARAGQTEADVEIAPGFQTDQLRRNGLLDTFLAPETRDYLTGTFDPGGAWATAYLNTDTMVYNTDRLKALGLRPPTAWADLARPEWRGKFALFTGSYEWYATMKNVLGDVNGDRLMRALAANSPVMVSTHQLALNMTAAGEYVAAINVYGYDVMRMARRGQPVALVNASPTVGEINAVALVKSGPHPNAARLFERWLLSRDTQRFVISTLGRISGRKDVKGDDAIWNPRMRIVITNPADSAGYADDVRAFNATFGLP